MKIHKEFARLFGFELLHIRKDQPSLASHLGQLLRLLKVSCLIDVGANAGQYGLMLRKAGYRGRIASFEPVTATFAELARLAATDPDWRTFKYALGSKPEEKEIRVTRSSVFASFLAPSEYSKEKYPEAMPIVDTERVQIRTLDEMLPEITQGIAAPRLFLKMDTQGYDLEVFAGAGKSLPQVLGLQTEISIQAIYEGMPDYLQSLTRYTQAGFVLTGLYPVSRDRETLGLIELDCVMRRL
jgi:FkbM family methyltransferase